MSADSSSGFADNNSLGTPSERSTTNNATNDDSDGEDWAFFFSDDDDDDEADYISRAACEDHEPGEGHAATPLHAMVLLGGWVGILASTELMGRPYANPGTQY